MKRIDDLEKTYTQCINTGSLKEKFVDFELIKSIRLISEKRMSYLNRNISNLSRNSSDWTFIFTGYYETLRNLIEAFILFDGISANNHQCKNAYICFKNPELGIEWEFLEIIRLIRNQINYEGRLINYDDWKKMKMQFDIHIKILSEKIDSKIKLN